MSLYGSNKAETYFEYVDEEHFADVIAYLLLEVEGYSINFYDLNYARRYDLEYLEDNKEFGEYVSDVALFEIQAES